MKLILSSIIIFFVVHIFENCTPTTHIRGTYTNTNVYKGLSGEEFKFAQDTNTFEYYSRLEGSISKYSAGTWILNKKDLMIQGFNDKNINLLNVNSKIEDNYQGGLNKISVIYKHDLIDTFIKVDLTINRNYKMRLIGDTTFQTSALVNTIQLKSYLIHNGLLLSVPTRVDTLYSPQIQINQGNVPKNITLQLSVSMIDFYRERLLDSLTIKNKDVLIFRKRAFKKISD